MGIRTMTRRGAPALALASAWTTGAASRTSAVVDSGVEPTPVYAGGRWCEGPVWSGRHGGLVWIPPDRRLYVSSSQVDRHPPPSAVLRMRIDADPA